MTSPEFARPVRLDAVGAQPYQHRIIAEPDELLALANRFGLLDISLLTANLAVVRYGDGVRVDGTVHSEVTQACIVSGLPVRAVIDEPVDLRFVRERASEAVSEVELDEDELDTLPLAGDMIDLGEVAAETMALALDTYPRAPDAAIAGERARLMSEDEAEAARQSSSPFAALRPRA